MFGASRFIYNLALETKQRAYNSLKVNLSAFDLINQAVELKNTDAPWLKAVPAQTLQSTIFNLDKAYIQFYKGGGYPKFKSKRSKQSLQFPQFVRVEFARSRVFIPKLKYVQLVPTRVFTGKVKTVTLSKTPTNKYYISVLVDNSEVLPNKKQVSVSTAVGVDLGIKTFATLSDGICFENPRLYSRNLKRLRVEQRKLSRRFKKGVDNQSNRYYKQKLVVALLHEKIKNQREDFLHKVSTSIVKKYDTICVEDLDLMSIQRNPDLALRMTELGCARFVKMIFYKAEWSGKNVLMIGRYDPSSKTCSTCGHIKVGMTLKDRYWLCPSCNTYHDRDLNAAVNIKNFGLRSQPSDVNVSH